MLKSMSIYAEEIKYDTPQQKKVSQVSNPPQLSKPSKSSGISTDKIYSYFVEFFKDPMFVKVKDESDGRNTFSMYVNKAHCMLSLEERYVIAFVLKDYEQVGFQKKLSQLEWVSFQMRTFAPRTFNVNTVWYDFYHYRPLENEKITRTVMDDKSSTYECESFPLVVVMLHTDKQKQYTPSSNLLSALNTWQTVLTLK